MKVKHLFFVAIALVGALYIVHMVTNHQGQSILSGIGIGK